MNFKIPNFKDLEIENIVFDYNGTLAKDGLITQKTAKLLFEICEKYKVFVITADTFGNAKEELKDFGLELVVLKSKNHTNEKALFVEKLNKNKTISVGNGNNDAKMLKTAIISIAIIGEEGCSKEALISSDIICKDINDAMGMFLNPKRLIATLRK